MHAIGPEQVRITELEAEAVLVRDEVLVAAARSGKTGDGRLQQESELVAAMNDRIVPDQADLREGAR